ncbi:MAG: M48 family metallopeptidase [Bacteroidales bacterium]|nr:M48 family metallopeptidase [Bacteroidales bacterium]
MAKFKVEIELEKRIREQIYSAIQGPVIERLSTQLSSSFSDIYWRSTMEGHSFKVQKNTMKHLYDLFYGVKKTLNFEGDIDFYITGDASVNAFSVASEKQGEPNIININSALIELMTDDELRFVVGHEIGHLINKDTHFRRILGFVYPDTKTAPVILQYKLRLNEQLCELVADRYGYLAIHDIKTCVSAFFKMSSGLDITKLDVDMKALIEENHKRLEYFLKGDGISIASHPVNPIRIQALNLFATCRKQESLDKKMDDLISILLKVGTSEVDQYMPVFIATAGLLTAYSDGEVTDEEYKHILDSLSNFEMFPAGFMDAIRESNKIPEMFEQSVAAILSVEPSLRDELFRYMLGVIFVDHKFEDKEINFIYAIGEKIFGYSEKEISSMFGAMIQLAFIPDIISLC